MALFKYIQLSLDIEGYLKHHKITKFSRRELARDISVENGFYAYSRTTLNNAIRLLENTGKVVSYIMLEDGVLYFTYMKSDAFIAELKVRHGDERPF